MSMKVYLLNLGSIEIDRSQQLWNIDPGTPVRIPSYGVLIDHSEGRFLFDTGFDLDHVQKVLPFEHPQQEPDQSVVTQLGLCGYAPGDVAYVINSHCHFDHVGGNRLVPSAITVMHKQELREAKVPEPFERFGYSDLSFDHPNVRYELVEGDIELAKGVFLYETPGHTVGHYSLLVELDSRAPMLFTADAVGCMEGLEKNMIMSFHNDPVAAVRSIKRIKALAKGHGAEIFVSHDMEVWQGWKHAPECYEG